MTKWRLDKLINREEYERVCEENRELKKLLLEKHYDDRRKSNFADYLERNLKQREKKMKSLTPAQDSELKFLRGIVDRCQEAAYKSEPLPNAKQNLWAAQEELDRYVSSLRKDDYHI